MNQPALSEQPAGKGPASNGPDMKGPASNGPASNGPARNGPARNGPASNGPARNGPDMGDGHAGWRAAKPIGISAPRADGLHHEAVMGTVVTFDVRTPAAAADVQAAVYAARDWLHWVDDTFSTYKPGSEVSRFDRGELAWAECSPELQAILALCRDFNKKTAGFFDAWAGARFDPSGVVKGWSIEQASSILVACGLPDHAIDGGGDVRLHGRPGPGRAWRVGVRHPLQRQAYSAALFLADGAVATSGTYERGAHVLNPFTGRPATELLSVTVVGPELTSADAYATAALAMGADAPDWLAGLDGYEAQVIGPQGRGWSSPGFKQLQRAPVRSGSPEAGAR